MPNAGIMASSVVTAVCTDVLQESFTSLAAWSNVGGSATLQAGRTGTAVQCAGAAARVDYSLAANAHEYITIGFAWQTVTSNVAAREVCQLYGDSNTSRHLRLVYNGTTAQTLSVLRDTTTLDTSSTGLIPVNTYAYIEIQARLHDTLGSVTVRVNGTAVITLTNVDTRNGGTVATFDTVRLTTAVSGLTNRWDDLYISVGSGCAFQGDHAIGQAVSFNATGQHYQRSGTGLNAATDLTWCCWVRLAVDRNAVSVILGDDNASANYYQMQAGSNGTLYQRDSPTGAASSGYDLPVGTWVFVAQVYSVSGQDYIYWAPAGTSTLTQSAAAGSGSGLADANTLRIGTNGFGNWLNGSVAAVKVWQAVLTQAELEAELPKYNAQRTTNLWASYSFRNGPQTTDESVNGRTLTPNGTAVADTSGPPVT